MPPVIDIGPGIVIFHGAAGVLLEEGGVVRDEALGFAQLLAGDHRALAASPWLFASSALGPRHSAKMRRIGEPVTGTRPSMAPAGAGAPAGAAVLAVRDHVDAGAASAAPAP